MKKLKRIGIIGCLADGYDMYDGQTVSTRVWRNEMESYSEKKLVVVDTYGYKKNIIKVIISLLKCLCSCTHIIIMLSGDGLKTILPVVYFAKKIKRFKVYHRVIGGELDRFIDINTECVKYLNALEVNWVQSPNLVRKLEDRGVKNVAFLENFRRIEPIVLSEIQRFNNKPFRFCTFCRVSVAKGIREAVKAIDDINMELGYDTAILDIYGPVEDIFADEFYTLISDKRGVSYKGCVQSEHAVFILKDYYMHLFPTTWSGEGFPGALIDCYNAALPTIATDWAYNSEYIRDGETGYLYDWHNHNLLTEKIKYAIQHPNEVFTMRKNCLAEAERYSADRIIKKVMEYMINTTGEI